MEATPPSPVLNFRPFFGSYTESIHDTISPNPEMAKVVHDAIERWISKTSYTVIYPKLSRKLVSRQTQELYRLMYPEDKDEKGEDIVINQVLIEQLYHKDGIQIGGCCQLKQKHVPNQLDPRTYFCQGGIAFHLSKYSPKITGLLNDEIPSSHRHMSFNPTRLVLPDNGYGLIYDLTSFTSMLYEHPYFLHTLAEYCEGVSVHIADASKGIIEHSLRDILMDLYLIHSYPSYEEDRYTDGHYLEGLHHAAGFLGVYSNISTAKFLHTAVVLQTVASTNELNCAGDDGLVGVIDEEYNLNAIRLCGNVSTDKMFRTFEDGAICLKRGIVQEGNRCYQQPLPIFPTLEYPIHDTDIDNRYERFLQLSKNERRSKVASTVVTFLQSIEHLPLMDEEMLFVKRMINTIYRDWNLPVFGNLPQCGGDIRLGIVPTVSNDYIGVEPIRNTIDQWYSGIAKLPERRSIDKPNLRSCNSVFDANSNANLSYLEKLGYYEKSNCDRVVFGETGYRELIHEFTSDIPKVYTYSKVKDVPFGFVESDVLGTL
jgi:hypothetical protein